MPQPPFLSLVIPAFNEEQRLPRTLPSIRPFLDQQGCSYDVTVVDDGSEDGTAFFVETLSRDWPNLRVIRNPHRGKAYAVQTGAMRAEGDLVFLCDADFSMPIHEVAKFLPYFADGYGVVIGSREGSGSKRIGEPSNRHMIGRIFNYIVRTVAVGGIQDTQCGFKCFRRDVARDVFPRLLIRTDGRELIGPMVTAFDVEVLYLARKRGYRIAEVGVEWHYAPGSKVSPLKDGLRMLVDVAKVRLNDAMGRYNRAPNGAPEVTGG